MGLKNLIIKLKFIAHFCNASAKAYIKKCFNMFSCKFSSTRFQILKRIVEVIKEVCMYMFWTVLRWGFQLYYTSRNWGFQLYYTSRNWIRERGILLYVHLRLLAEFMRILHKDKRNFFDHLRLQIWLMRASFGFYALKKTNLLFLLLLVLSFLIVAYVFYKLLIFI